MGKSKILAGCAINFAGSNTKYFAEENLKQGDYSALTPISADGGVNYVPGEVQKEVTDGKM